MKGYLAGILIVLSIVPATFCPMMRDPTDLSQDTSNDTLYALFDYSSEQKLIGYFTEHDGMFTPIVKCNKFSKLIKNVKDITKLDKLRKEFKNNELVGYKVKDSFFSGYAYYDTNGKFIEQDK